VIFTWTSFLPESCFASATIFPKSGVLGALPVGKGRRLFTINILAALIKMLFIILRCIRHYPFEE